jgi:hypothetical protein
MLTSFFSRTPLVILSLLVLSCTGPGKASEPLRVQQSSPASTNQTLLTLQYHGGMCPDGACESVTALRRDGTYTRTIGKGTPREGSVSRQKVDTLSQEIARADFARIKSVPFTGTCPIAYDGQEAIYTFQTAVGPQEIASCKVQIDENSSLFKAVQAIVDEVNAP